MISFFVCVYSLLMLNESSHLWAGRLYAMGCGQNTRSIPFKHCWMEIYYSPIIQEIPEWWYELKYFFIFSSSHSDLRARFWCYYLCRPDNWCFGSRSNNTSCMHIIGTLGIYKNQNVPIIGYICLFPPHKLDSLYHYALYFFVGNHISITNFNLIWWRIIFLFCPFFLFLYSSSLLGTFHTL